MAQRCFLLFSNDKLLFQVYQTAVTCTQVSRPACSIRQHVSFPMACFRNAEVVYTLWLGVPTHNELLSTLDITHVIKFTRLSPRFFVRVKGHAINLCSWGRVWERGYNLGTTRSQIASIVKVISANFKCTGLMLRTLANPYNHLLP